MTGGETLGTLVSPRAGSATFVIVAEYDVAATLSLLGLVAATDSSSGSPRLRYGSVDLPDGSASTVLVMDDPTATTAGLDSGAQGDEVDYVVLTWGETSHGFLAGRIDGAEFGVDITTADANKADLPAAARRIVVSSDEFWADDFDPHAYGLRLARSVFGLDDSTTVRDPGSGVFQIPAIVPTIAGAEDFEAVLEMLHPELLAAIVAAEPAARRTVARLAATEAVRSAANRTTGLDEMDRPERWQRYSAATLAAERRQRDDNVDPDEDDDVLDQLRSEQNAWLAAWFALDADPYTACVGAVHGLIMSESEEGGRRYAWQRSSPACTKDRAARNAVTTRRRSPPG